ncbi:MAG: hypothetical protein WD934_06510 [Gemmatimonadales bacterium]
MSKLMDRILRAALVLGVVGALAFGVQTVAAARTVTQCQCDPADGGADAFCELCCEEMGSICPGGGVGLRECLCAG